MSEEDELDSASFPLRFPMLAKAVQCAVPRSEPFGLVAARCEAAGSGGGKTLFDPSEEEQGGFLLEMPADKDDVFLFERHRNELREISLW